MLKTSTHKQLANCEIFCSHEEAEIFNEHNVVTGSW